MHLTQDGGLGLWKRFLDLRRPQNSDLRAPYSYDSRNFNNAVGFTGMRGWARGYSISFIFSCLIPSTFTIILWQCEFNFLRLILWNFTDFVLQYFWSISTSINYEYQKCSYGWKMLLNKWKHDMKHEQFIAPGPGKCCIIELPNQHCPQIL